MLVLGCDLTGPGRSSQDGRHHRHVSAAGSSRNGRVVRAGARPVRHSVPRLGVRMDMLDGPAESAKPLDAGDYDLEGKHFQLKDARCDRSPCRSICARYRGSGERRTLRIVAEHGDIGTCLRDVPSTGTSSKCSPDTVATSAPSHPTAQVLTFRALLDEDEEAAQDRARDLFGDPMPELSEDDDRGHAEHAAESRPAYADLGVGDFLLGSMIRSTGRRSTSSLAPWRRR